MTSCVGSDCHVSSSCSQVPDAQLARFQYVYDNCSTASGITPPTRGSSCKAVASGRGITAAPGGLVECCYRQYYSAMTNYVDGHIGAVVGALKVGGDLGLLLWRCSRV